MGIISPYSISKIIDATQIDDVLGEFISLKRRGANLIANCPFHGEKTPSFIVSPAKGIYKCFGCGVSGNAVKFLMEHEQLSYPDALRYLAKKYNIEIEEVEQTSEAKEIVDKRESLFIALSYAQRHFQDNLWNTEEGKSIGLSYFKERGFSDEIIQKFQLGYCLDTWQHFSDTALGAGYKSDILVECGLIKPNDKGGFRDFYKGRVIFPIHNLVGKTIGFGGRILKKDEKAPKYINSPESEIYNKSKVLYGLDLAKKAVRQEDVCYLVEGYTDVISLHQGGVENVVSSSGTSLTEEQIKQIKKFSENLTILYDGDNAGIKAALRGMEMVLEQGVNVKLVLLPEGEDPDSYIRKVGAENLRNYIKEQATDFILFKTKLLQKEDWADPIKRSELIAEIIEAIAKIPDPIKRAIYVKECSARMDVKEQLLVTEVQRLRRKELYDKKNYTSEEKETIEKLVVEKQTPEYLVESADVFTTLYTCERELCRILVEFGNALYTEEKKLTQFILEYIEGLDFKHESYSQILQHIRKLQHENIVMDSTYFLQNEQSVIRDIAIELTAQKYEIANWNNKNLGVNLPTWGENYKRETEQAVARFKYLKIQDLIEENQQQIKQENLPQEELSILLKVQAHLNGIKKELAAEIGNTII